ncbi:RNA polymerase III-inhibiting protein maf1, partial [Clydaea vesicula]
GVVFGTWQAIKWKQSELNMTYTFVPALIVGVVSYYITAIFLSVYDSAIDTIFMCFLEDDERNDGSLEKPYYYSDNLKKITGHKNAEEANFRFQQMKYLECSQLEALNSALNCIDTGDLRMFGRIECYSCKNTYDDKKLFSYFNKKYEKEESTFEVKSLSSHSPELFNHLSTSDGLNLVNFAIPRKNLFFLLATLNAAFPDYDFSDVKPDAFITIPKLGLVVNNVNTTLFNMGNEKFAKIAGTSIWDSINEIINLDECEIYSFIPSLEIEPDAEEGNVWSFYYFFFNKILKRMIFFTCRAVSFMAQLQDGENPDLINDLIEDDELSLKRQDSQER